MPRETAAISAHILLTPCNHAPVDSVVRATYVRLRLGYNRCKYCAKGKNYHRAIYLKPQEATVVYWLHAVMLCIDIYWLVVGVMYIYWLVEGVMYTVTGCRCSVYVYILTGCRYSVYVYILSILTGSWYPHACRTAFFSPLVTCPLRPVALEHAGTRTHAHTHTHTHTHCTNW